MKTNKLILGSGLLIAVFSLLVVVGVQAATDRYQFVARGLVTAVNGTLNTVTVSVTHVTGKAAVDLQGNTPVFKASSAKIYKTAGGKDVRIKLTNIAVGDELVVKGIAKSDGTYVLTWARVHTRSFELVGTLKAHDKALKRLTVATTSSSFKPETYKNKDVVVKYSTSTTFKSGGTVINADEIEKGDHKIKVSGKLVGNQWEADTFIDNYSGK